MSSAAKIANWSMPVFEKLLTLAAAEACRTRFFCAVTVVYETMSL